MQENKDQTNSISIDTTKPSNKQNKQRVVITSSLVSFDENSYLSPEIKSGYPFSDFSGLSPIGIHMVSNQTKN